MLFGQFVRDARQSAGLSLEKLAKHLGVTKVYVSDVERGLRPPFTQERLTGVAEALGLDGSELSKLAAMSRDYVKLPVSGCCEAKVHLAGTLGYVWLGMTEEHAKRVQKVISEE